jgi:uncharacterized membrane protein YdbT with pleckstrin-like domain
MSYVQQIVQPGERILAVGKLHWIVYLPAVLLAVGALVVYLFAAGLENGSGFRFAVQIVADLILAAGAVFFVRELFHQWITELAVTDRRVIFKTGFIRRRTVEMNMDKVETVDVDQTILGRILGYGTIHVLGTGSGIEHLRQVAHPLELRSAITAK